MGCNPKLILSFNVVTDAQCKWALINMKACKTNCQYWILNLIVLLKTCFKQPPQ